MNPKNRRWFLKAGFGLLAAPASLQLTGCDRKGASAELSDEVNPVGSVGDDDTQQVSENGVHDSETGLSDATVEVNAADAETSEVQADSTNGISDGDTEPLVEEDASEKELDSLNGEEDVEVEDSASGDSSEFVEDSEVSSGQDSDTNPPEIETCELTGKDVEGPFYIADAPEKLQLADSDEEGDRIRISGQVFQEDCTTPIQNALLDIWQADAAGNYPDASMGYKLRGTLLTNDKGEFVFESIWPGRYPMGSSFRPAHIHFKISAAGHVGITTQMYFEGDPYLAPADPCQGCNSGDETLIVSMSVSTEDESLQEGVFDIVLQSE